MRGSASKNVLVTGVTSGVGQSLARMLKDRGYYVIGVCRNSQQAASLKSDHLCDATVLADLGNALQVQTIAQQLRALGIDELAGFLHCAAVMFAAPIETVKMDDARKTFEVNVFGFLALMQSMIEFLRKGKGRVVVTGSAAGFSVWPMVGIYGATKHAIEALVDAARRELWPWGIKVSLLRPGGISTRMVTRHVEHMAERVAALEGKEKENYLELYKSHAMVIDKGGNMGVTPEHVAKIIIRVFESRNPKPAYCIGADSKILRFLDLLFPDSVVDFLSKKIFS